MKQQPEHYTTREVADKFGVSVGTVSDWIRKGKLKAIRPAGRWLIPVREVERQVEH